MVKVGDLRYIFLLYVPRSGSTWLAKNLSQASSEILVLPELKTLEILFKLNDFSNSRKLAEYIFSDPRWKNLEINFDELETLIKEVKKPNPKSIIDAIVQHLISKRKINPKAVLFKNGTSIWQLDKIEKQYFNYSFLHIYRDPRGCISSMLKAKAAFRPNEKFTLKNSLQLARYYNKYRTQVNKIDKDKLIEIAYESMVLNESNELNKLIKKLNLKAIQNASSLIISEEEKKLHANVDKKALKERIDAWKKDLSIEDGKLIEHLCDIYLSKENYFLETKDGLAQIKFVKTFQALLINLSRPFLAVLRYIKTPNVPYLKHRIRIWLRN